jgi:hypothetical protein
LGDFYALTFGQRNIDRRRFRLSASDRDSSRRHLMEYTGYGSARFLRACQISTACRQIEGSGPRALWARLRNGSLLLWWYDLRLPSVRVRVTESPTGRMIEEHFSIRERGRWRFRGAQGVLPLPADPSEYLRGRRRQAVRTNVGHARGSGLTVETEFVADWEPGTDDSRVAYITPGPVERWNVMKPDGEVVAQAILSVDDDAALLHGLVTIADSTNARWLLHTAIVERLCGSCSVLLTNSDDAYLMGAGTQHFQRLLGYGIARPRLQRECRRRDSNPRHADYDSAALTS